MNKEAKVGLTIILILLITFLAVLGGRLYRSYRSAHVAATDKDSKEKEINFVNTDDVVYPNTDERISDTAAGPRSPAAAGNELSDGPPDTTNGEDSTKPKTDDEKFKIFADGESEVKSPRSNAVESSSAVDDRGQQPGQDRGRWSESYRMRAKSDQSENVNALDARHGLNHDNGGKLARRGQTYTVAGGESLFDIARCKLGKASRWVEIYDLNADVLGKDIDSLPSGISIVIPEINAN
jgi:hypothetical protein